MISTKVSTPRPEWLSRLTEPLPPRNNKTSIPDPPGYTSSQVLTTTTPSVSKSSQKSRKGNNNKDKDKDDGTAALTTTPSVSKPLPLTPEAMDTLKVKKAFEVAMGPAKQVPMQAIGMYMTGNSLQSFTIIMVFMLLKGAVQAVMNLSRAFRPFETPTNGERILLAKLLYVATNGLLLALGLYKMNKMGILPTTTSDWLAWEAPWAPLERAFMVT